MFEAKRLFDNDIIEIDSVFYAPAEVPSPQPTRSISIGHRAPDQAAPTRIKVGRAHREGQPRPRSWRRSHA